VSEGPGGAGGARIVNYFVYIATNRNRTLYTGVTNDLDRRQAEHADGLSGFTAKYRISRIVYFEDFSDVNEAIAREKQIKSYRRSKKIALIESMTPNWKDGREVFL
jgi:putative endonuclease